MPAPHAAGRRMFSLDVIRAFAALSVLAVHFFLHTGFYEIPSQGAVMAAAVFLRTQLMVCVPLFLVLTGYLQKEKIWCPGYIRGLIPLLVTYLLASMVCAGFRAFHLGGTWSPISWLRDILAFSAAPYAWYIQQYIGLYLLIPFLNAAWSALPGQKPRLALVLTALLLTVGPSLNTLSLALGFQLLPTGWEDGYFAAYYFVGCYLREYPPKCSWPWLFGANLGAVTLGGLLHFCQAGGEPFGYFPPTHWNGVFTCLSTVSLFVLMSRLQLKGLPRPVRRGISLIASLSLPLFLVSWVSDSLVYEKLTAALPDFSQRLLWFFPAVAAVLLLSLLLALAVFWYQQKLFSPRTNDPPP